MQNSVTQHRAIFSCIAPPSLRKLTDFVFCKKVTSWRRVAGWVHKGSLVSVRWELRAQTLFMVFQMDVKAKAPHPVTKNR